MEHKEGTFEVNPGFDLYYQTWEPANPQAGLVIVHGVQEHSGRYEALATGLAERGMAVASFDLRGHGRSPGVRGHINDFSEYRHDLGSFLAVLRSRWSGLPIFLYGHSLGSLITIDYLMHSPDEVPGAIFSGTMVTLGDAASPAKKAMARILSRIAPTFTLPSDIHTEYLSHRPEIGEAYQSDPLIFHHVTVRWGAEMLRELEYVTTHPQAIQTPFLMVHGESDSLCYLDGAKGFFQRIPLADKTLQVYSKAYHEVHNELCAEQVKDDIASWIKARLP